MPTPRKGKGAARPTDTTKKRRGRKIADLPSKRTLKVTNRHIGAHVKAVGKRRQAKRDSR